MAVTTDPRRETHGRYLVDGFPSNLLVFHRRLLGNSAGSRHRPLGGASRRSDMIRHCPLGGGTQTIVRTLTILRWFLSHPSAGTGATLTSTTAAPHIRPGCFRKSGSSPTGARTRCCFTPLLPGELPCAHRPARRCILRRIAACRAASVLTGVHYHSDGIYLNYRIRVLERLNYMQHRLYLQLH
jgi:hypothetical protein